MVRARFVSPRRGPRGSLRFSFQDLVLLRTARGLLAARISSRRVNTALRAIRSQLPQELPLRGFSITAAGDQIIVHQAGEQRDALSGQLLLALEVRVDSGAIQLVDVSTPRTIETSFHDDCARQFEAALALEESDVGAAVEAYRACVARHAHSGAVANLGRLLHLEGRISEAVRLYRSIEDPDANVLYNLAVALEDLGRIEEATTTYNRVIGMDAEHEDAHHNIARLYQEAGDQRRALRHWNAYRKLTRASCQE
jgi:tetratricopeptide (TPR) repeat protein